MQRQYIFDTDFISLPKKSIKQNEKKRFVVDLKILL